MFLVDDMDLYSCWHASLLFDHTHIMFLLRSIHVYSWWQKFFSLMTYRLLLGNKFLLCYKHPSSWWNITIHISYRNIYVGQYLICTWTTESITSSHDTWGWRTCFILVVDMYLLRDIHACSWMNITIYILYKNIWL